MNSLQALNLAAPMADTYNRLEEMLLCHIAEQLAANPDTLINATSQWRIKMLAQMGRLTADTAKIIAQMTGKAPEMVESVVSAAVDEVLDEYGLELTDKLSDNISQSLKNYDLQAVKSKYNQVNTVMQYKAKQLYTKSVNGVADRFERIKQKALENSQEYLDVLNKNAMAVVVGEKSRTEALRETIAEMNKKGIPAFVDASGREWSPEAYINMDIRNTAKNSALAAEFASLDELGQDVILVSSHSGARPKCFPYQGKFYSRSGKSGTITDAKGQTYSYSPLKDTSFGEPDGLFGINCGHRMRGVSDGTFINREKAYSEKENSEEYEQVQRQRQKERQIRKEKTHADMLEAAGDAEEAKKYRNRATQHNRELKAYCEENGLSYRKDRTGTYGYKDTEKRTINRGTIDTVRSQETIKQHIDFSKINSVEELADEMQRITGKSVNLSGTDLELMKRNMQQIVELGEEYGYRFDAIEVTSAKKYIGEVSRTGRYGEKTILNYPQKYYQSREILISELKKSSQSNAMPPISGRNIDIYTSTHEFGHTLSEELTSRLYGRDVEFWDEIEQIYADYKKRGNDILGKYAGSNQNEFLAEAFANAKLHPQPTEWSVKTLEVVDKYFKVSVDNSVNSGIINTGVFSGAKKTFGWENRHGELMYEEIRHRTTDVKKISEFTPFTESAVEEIKQHMFFAEHKFADGSVKRFDSDFDQAQAWDRLSQGKGTDADIMLLKHEYVELTQMRLHGYDYETAHEIANRYHNWAEILLKEMK